MPRKPKPSITRRVHKEDWRIYYLLHGELPPEQENNSEAFLFKSPDSGAPRELWGEEKDTLLSQWIHQNPCTRPWAWWKHDATEERLKVSGDAVKTPLAYAPFYRYGVYKYWEWDGEEPLFESQAAYLKRHKLLTKGEEKHLEKHPELLDPESYGSVFDD